MAEKHSKLDNNPKNNNPKNPDSRLEQKSHVLGEILLARAEKLKSLNETLTKEVWSDFRCILKWNYYNLLYKWEHLKIDMKQEDWVINVAKLVKEIMQQIKKEWLDWNKEYYILI